MWLYRLCCGWTSKTKENDSNRIRTHNRLVRKWTLNHLAKLAKWLSCVVSTYLHGAFDCMLLTCMSRTRFRVNLYSIVAQMSRNSLLKTGAISEVYTFDIAPVSSKELLNIQATTECRFTLKPICNKLAL